MRIPYPKGLPEWLTLPKTKLGSRVSVVRGFTELVRQVSFPPSPTTSNPQCRRIAIVNRLLTFACVVAGMLSFSAGLAAQDLVITNARIIDGNGGVIPDESVVGHFE